MQATQWEFRNRALVFGLIFALAFQFYFVDHQNATAALAHWLAVLLKTRTDPAAHALFGFAAALVMVAALIRTWASAYLHAGVVYAAQVKTASLVADGPYRHVRNPLYLGNVLMAAGMGAMTSRIGFVVSVAGMLIFCYRLILREEAELGATQGEQYEQYRKLVPRLWPALRARLPSSERQPAWLAGFKAESWYWGLAVSLVAFALTLKLKLFFGILALSLAGFWISMFRVQRKDSS